MAEAVHLQLSPTSVMSFHSAAPALQGPYLYLW